MLDPEVSDANALAGYVSGAMILKSSYTAARAGYLDNIGHTIINAINYTATRAGYIDNLVRDNIYPASNAFYTYSSPSTGTITYTVGVGSTVYIYSIAFIEGDGVPPDSTVTINGVDYSSITYTGQTNPSEGFNGFIFSPPIQVTAGNTVVCTGIASAVGVVIV